MKPLNIKGKTETAFIRILEPYKDSQDLSGFQWVYRFFTGKLQEKRVSVVCGSPVVLLRDEDLTPVTWEIPVHVEIVTGKRATTNIEHDELVATVAEAIYDGSDTCAALNEAMAGEGFKALAWTFGDGPEDEIDDQARKSKLVGTLMTTPFSAA